MQFEKAYFEAAFGTPKQLKPSDCKEVAFSGRSNVGKSSLINKILNRKGLAKVSSQPGKTVTINFYNTVDSRLVDLPGYGYAKVSAGEKRRWADLMDAYFSTGRNIALVVQLVDMRHKPSELDLDMIDYLEQMGYDFVIALTKSDKLNKTETKNRLESFEEELSFLDKKPKMIPVSSLKGDGIEELKAYISLKVKGEE
ncbi:MAG: ribosome biogenesis GTP-binding protein YihA/YsxC [Acutalibacteraceae bacterium]|nr:ribosome biogenesis GTP-binding protein YihA/YsxC [Acutalibacteraceae bacterium]